MLAGRHKKKKVLFVDLPMHHSMDVLYRSPKLLATGNTDNAVGRILYGNYGKRSQTYGHSYSRQSSGSSAAMCLLCSSTALTLFCILLLVSAAKVRKSYEIFLRSGRFFMRSMEKSIFEHFLFRYAERLHASIITLHPENGSMGEWLKPAHR